MAINDLTESSHLARVILDIFPKRGGENAIRLARAIRTMIIMTMSEAEEKPTAPKPLHMGDIVTIKVKISGYDGDRILPYEIKLPHGGFDWIEPSDIDGQEKAEAPVKTSLAIGDTVLVKATLVEIDDSDEEQPYRVSINNHQSYKLWMRPEDIDGQEVAK